MPRKTHIEIVDYYCIINRSVEGELSLLPDSFISLFRKKSQK